MITFIDSIKTKVFIEWFYNIKWKTKDNKTTPAYISKTEELKGNFAGLAKHIGKIYQVTFLLPDNPNDPDCVKFTEHVIPFSHILKIADKIREIQKTESVQVCEIE